MDAMKKLEPPLCQAIQKNLWVICDDYKAPFSISMFAFGEIGNLQIPPPQGAVPSLLCTLTFGASRMCS